MLIPQVLTMRLAVFCPEFFAGLMCSMCVYNKVSLWNKLARQEGSASCRNKTRNKLLTI